MRPLIILTGPTAVGKTQLSLSLAKALDGEIVSADSMQVYRHMDIGSAKIRVDEMQGVRHHLIDVLDPQEPFDVVRFQRLAKAAIEDIYSRGKIPILTGGTGFYIQAVLYDIDFTETDEHEGYRSELELLAAREGAEVLYEQLRKVDPEAALAIHPRNVRRVVRALEYHHQTGLKISQHNAEQRKKESPYHFLYLVLNDERGRLYERIDRRVDQMMASGLLQEVRMLREMGCTGEMTSMKGLGYKELLNYLEGACSLEEAVSVIKRDTRHFAKRQLTWFKREREVHWLYKPDFVDSEARIMEQILQLAAEKHIIKRNEE